MSMIKVGREKTRIYKPVGYMPVAENNVTVEPTMAPTAVKDQPVTAEPTVVPTTESTAEPTKAATASKRPAPRPRRAKK